MFSVLPDLIDKVLGEHRGFGHSVIWLIPITISFLINIQLGLAFFSAFSMHILLDTVTKKGVPFLYPFSKTRLVMPKKEKSRIITGSKKEKALLIILILLLLPVSYGVLHGFPQLDPTLNLTNKTNKSNNTTSGDLRSLQSYPNSTYTSGKTSTSPYNSVESALTKDLKDSSLTNNQTTISDDNGIDKMLQDWLNSDTGNQKSNQTNNTQTNDQNNTTTNQDNNNNQTSSEDSSDALTDLLFGDVSKYLNLTEGQQFDETMNMTEDNSTPTDFDGFNSDSDVDDDSDYEGEVFLSILTLGALGGALGKF